MLCGVLQANDLGISGLHEDIKKQFCGSSLRYVLELKYSFS